MEDADITPDATAAALLRLIENGMGNSTARKVCADFVVGWWKFCNRKEYALDYLGAIPREHEPDMGMLCAFSDRYRDSLPIQLVPEELFVRLEARLRDFKEGDNLVVPNL